MEPRFNFNSTGVKPMANDNQVELFDYAPQETEEQLKNRINNEYKGAELMYLARTCTDARTRSIAEWLVSEQLNKNREDPQSFQVGGK